MSYMYNDVMSHNFNIMRSVQRVVQHMVCANLCSPGNTHNANTISTTIHGVCTVHSV